MKKRYKKILINYYFNKFKKDSVYFNKFKDPWGPYNNVYIFLNKHESLIFSRYQDIYKEVYKHCKSHVSLFDNFDIIPYYGIILPKI